MLRDFGVVCIALLCVCILKVQAGGCPYGHSPALPKRKQPASNKTEEEILKERLQ